MREGFVLDTGVVAEPGRPRPDAAVASWLSALPAASLFLAATIVAELRYGVELEPEGERRNRLAGWLERLLAAGFAGRVLPFDADAARIWGRLMAEGRRAGRAPAIRDAETAATAMARGLVVATRNTRG